MSAGIFCSCVKFLVFVNSVNNAVCALTQILGIKTHFAILAGSHLMAFIDIHFPKVENVKKRKVVKFLDLLMLIAI